MEYKLEVSPDFLAHHGTKGMKWGVWNDETKRKYGLLKAAGGGGGGSKDDEEEEESSESEGLTSGDMRADRDSVIGAIARILGEEAESELNMHLSDIEYGNISQAEAQVLSIINAATKAATGEPAIRNPKGGTYADQDDSVTRIEDGKVKKYR